jgi:hypothetical protein
MTTTSVCSTVGEDKEEKEMTVVWCQSNSSRDALLKSFELFEEGAALRLREVLSETGSTKEIKIQMTVTRVEKTIEKCSKMTICFGAGNEAEFEQKSAC